MGESSESSARPTTLAEARERLAEARAAVRRNEGLGSGRSGEGAGDDLASKVETVRRAVAAMNSGEALADVRERKVGSARTHSGTADADQGSPSKAVGVAVELIEEKAPGRCAAGETGHLLADSDLLTQDAAPGAPLKTVTPHAALPTA